MKSKEKKCIHKWTNLASEKVSIFSRGADEIGTAAIFATVCEKCGNIKTKYVDGR